jgi:AraC family transcriptional regulator of arabinose operon
MSKEITAKRRDGFEGQKLIVVPKKIVTGFLTKDTITKQIHITDIGYYPKADNHYVERPSGISQYIIIYCTEGFGWVEINKKKLQVSPSQFIAIPANIPHKYGANKEKPWTIYWVHFKGDMARTVFDLVLKNSENYKPYLSFTEDRIKLFENIYFNLERGYNFESLRYVNMIFYHFLTSLIYEDKFNYSNYELNPGILEQVILHMQKNITKHIRLEDFANLANLSISHFSALFKAETGYAPIEYFNHLKVQKACQYLSFTEMPVKNIALDLGVEDPYYFSRMFSKLMGMSPNDYRKKMRLEPECP